MNIGGRIAIQFDDGVAAYRVPCLAVSVILFNMITDYGTGRWLSIIKQRRQDGVGSPRFSDFLMC